ncbi:MAG: ABC transporter substrate-binding protein [Anaerolineae bacterium]
MRRLFVVLMVLALLAGTAVVPAHAQARNILIVATQLDDVITLDPGRAFETTNLVVHHATYETLLEITADNLSEIKPALAESYTISEDGLTYTFTLNPNAKFASGNPVTAADVVFSWNRLINLKGNPSFYLTDANVVSVEATEERVVTVTLSAPFPAFASVVTAPALSILDSKLVKENGGTDASDAETADTAKDWLDQNSAGSGAFILTKWTPNSEIVMVRNENWWRGTAKVDGVTLRNVNDAASALQLVARGDADIAQGVDADTAEQAKGDSNLKLAIGQTLNLLYLAISPSDFFGLPISDQRVRQAIAYAIDYDGIVTLAGGYTERPAAMLPIGIAGSDPSKRYTRDLEKAKALLAEAGVADGFTITLSIGGGSTAGVPREVLAAKLQADLAEVGITVEINQQTSANFLTAFRAQELPMVLSAWTPDYLDPTMWSGFFSKEDSGVSARIRLTGYPNIAELADMAGNERDPAKRAELYAQYQAAHVEAAVFIPLMQEQTIDVLRSNVEGYLYHPVYFVDFASISK